MKNFYEKFLKNIEFMDKESAEAQRIATNEEAKSNCIKLLRMTAEKNPTTFFNWAIKTPEHFEYFQISENYNDPEKAVTVKTVKMSDIFALKKTKNSAKIPLTEGQFSQLYCTLEAFGANLSEEYFSTKSDTPALLKVYLKFAGLEPHTFNGKSINALEKQLQIIFNTMLGADEFTPKAKKMYVRHLSEMFTRAIRTTDRYSGYKNGNAIQLLQLVVEHARDAKNGVNYGINSGLACHKAPIENPTTPPEKVPDRV